MNTSVSHPSLPTASDIPAASADDVATTSVTCRAITHTLSDWVNKGTVAGIVWLVADADGVLDCEGIGYANVAKRRPMKPDTFFWIASITKPMTTVALMMLVEEGKIGLDDPVWKYLPEFAGLKVKTASNELRSPAHPITIREILSHTSGLPYATLAETPALDRYPLAEAVRSYAHEHLLFEPGSNFLYSNEGINIAGRIIELLSSRSYEDFMQQRLFSPLGMNDTTFWPDASQLARLASIYGIAPPPSPLEEQTVVQLSHPLNDRARRYPVPAGGLFSTATDIAKFGRMLLRGGELDGHRYLRRKTITLMASRQIPAHVDNAYGLGTKLFSHNNVFGHNGATGANLSIDVKNGIVTIYLMHRNGWETADGDQVRLAFQASAAGYKGKPTEIGMSPAEPEYDPL
ncbi:serine hydrolase domain-containing protein [Geminisphaera colitermitum]|uniref:serine hydrolase domain-containing protein n=1 Tax=Geminisphaera colitermitum TaxID=1148786 RepID=UPI0001965003|nr:serine hydrolase domain-containing protein [Geminisphaera colitermitum]